MVIRYRRAVVVVRGDHRRQRGSPGLVESQFGEAIVIGAEPGLLLSWSREDQACFHGIFGWDLAQSQDQLGFGLPGDGRPSRPYRMSPPITECDDGCPAVNSRPSGASRNRTLTNAVGAPVVSQWMRVISLAHFGTLVGGQELPSGDALVDGHWDETLLLVARWRPQQSAAQYPVWAKRRTETDRRRLGSGERNGETLDRVMVVHSRIR